MCRSMPVKFKSGLCYILLIIDYSDMYFIYFLKNKNDTLFICRMFQEKYKNVLGKDIRTDRY